MANLSEKRLEKRLKELESEVYGTDVTPDSFEYPEDLGGDGSGVSEEEVEDIVAALVDAGDNLSWTYDDGNDTLRVDTTALNEEETQDAVAALLGTDTHLTLTYNDQNDTLTVGLGSHAGTHEKGGADELATFGDTTHDSVQASEASVSNAPVDPNDVARQVELSEKADLDDNDVVISSQIPDLAITETYSVADESARLSLAAEEGDVAIQGDNDLTYIFTGGDPSVDSNWSQILFPEPPVDSVFGRTGSVSPQSGDYTASQVGASAEGHDHSGDSISPTSVDTDDLTNKLHAIEQGDSLTVNSGSQVTVASDTYHTIFDVATAQDVIGGVINGYYVRDLRVTWGDDTIESIINSPSAGADNTGDTFDSFDIPPLKGVKQLEFFADSASDNDFGYRVVRV